MAECQRCPFNDIVKAIAAMNKTFTVSSQPSSTKELNAIQYFIYICRKKKLTAKAEKALPTFTRFIDFINKDLLPKFQQICLTCSNLANDDNPSHQGQTFVSIDAMSAKAPTVDYSDPREGINNDIDIQMNKEEEIEDPNGEQGQMDVANQRINATSDWVEGNMERTMANQKKNINKNDDSVSKLPVHIEDMLKEQFATFFSLPMIDKLLVLHQMCNDSFVSFGTMKWLPPEVKKPLSKQVVCQHWAQICKKFPIAEALRAAKPGRGFTSRFNRNYTEDTFKQCELELMYKTTQD